jgi:hypothetical protein
MTNRKLAVVAVGGNSLVKKKLPGICGVTKKMLFDNRVGSGG